MLRNPGDERLGNVVMLFCYEQGERGRLILHGVRGSPHP
jgi:hypothetical protein